MTDLEKTIELYKGFGIYLKQHESAGQIILALNCAYTESEKGKGFGNINTKFGGYSSCMSDICFTKEGAFIKQCFWEG